MCVPTVVEGFLVDWRCFIERFFVRRNLRQSSINRLWDVADNVWRVITFLVDIEWDVICNFPNFKTLRTHQKASSTLPNHYVFSNKGMLEFDQLSMSKFVSGYLVYLNTQPELSKRCLLNHLQLLVDKATTYSCAVFVVLSTT